MTETTENRPIVAEPPRELAPDDRRRDRTLWIGFALPIAAAIVTQQTNFLLTPWICDTGHRWVYPVISLVALAVSVSGGVIARSAGRRADRPADPELGLVEERRKFMSVVGTLVAIFFSLVIVAMAVPGVVHRPCD